MLASSPNITYHRLCLAKYMELRGRWTGEKPAAVPEDRCIFRGVRVTLRPVDALSAGRIDKIEQEAGERVV